MAFVETIQMILIWMIGVIALGFSVCLAISVSSLVYTYVKQYYVWFTHRKSLESKRQVRN